jgi:ABC-type transporter lipoprotein component MlaA/pimeloyl-ACP methyl ester carboxylesterase
MGQPTGARISLVFLTALLLALGGGMVVPPIVGAQEKDSSRELSNLSVMGVDKLRSPTHREHFEVIQYMPDRIEGFNRGSLAVTKPVIHWVMRPLAKGWRFITPSVVRRGVSNFSYNIAFPSRFVSLLLQGRPVDSGVETGHFLVNTTVGVAGFIDAAGPWGIPTYRQDVGLAFNRWGFGHGTYLFIPFLGPSSARDGVGRLFDMALTPVYLVPGLGALLNINAFSFRIDGYEALAKSEADLYDPIRALWSIQRQIAMEEYEIPEEAYETSDPEPSLGVLLLKPKDRSFPASAREHHIQTPTTGQQLPYSLWLQKQSAPLVVLIPGIGAHRNSRNAVSIAEMAFDRGYSVVNVTSPFHGEFIRKGLSVPYPGYTPSDADDLYAAISEIHRDLEVRYPERVTFVSLIGYSLGAIEALHIAAAEDSRSPDALRFERYVAINPPVDLRYAARGFDGYFNSPLRWPEEERDERVKELAMKGFLVAQHGLPEGKPLPVNRIESEFLIGLAGRATIIGALAAIEKRIGHGLEIRREEIEGRGPLLDIVNQSSLDNYAAQLTTPYYLEKRRHRVDADELAFEAGLRSLEKALRTNEKIRIVTNANDFILGEENLAWLREVVGDRVTVFPDGGHLGNMHLPVVQKAVLAALGSAPQNPHPREKM